MREAVSGWGGEAVCPPATPVLSPAVKLVTQLEMAHSACMLQGLTSIKKGSTSEPLQRRQESEIKADLC